MVGLPPHQWRVARSSRASASQQQTEPVRPSGPKSGRFLKTQTSVGLITPTQRLAAISGQPNDFSASMFRDIPLGDDGSIPSSASTWPSSTMVRASELRTKARTTGGRDGVGLLGLAHLDRATAFYAVGSRFKSVHPKTYRGREKGISRPHLCPLEDGDRR